MVETRTGQLTLTDMEWPRFLRGPDPQLLEKLYVPALSRAVRYDRCCAYFNSRVLAVAARGFGGLIGNILAQAESLPKPAVRLLVNEELAPDDLEALLTTDEQAPLIDKLLRQFKTPQRALEKNRLAMLAWLTAQGWLEVRVALMRHTQGVSHAKYGIIADGAGNRLAFSGSDNETGHALVENYEEVHIGTEWQDPAFVRYYQDRFDAIWNDRDEFVTTVPLPEAVRLELIKLAPADAPIEILADTDEASTAMLWRFIAAAPFLPNGELACDATAFVDLWPHQQHVVTETTRAFPAGRLLCDEVGMGKTIEAILILRRLLAGRGVKRALILVPAGLLGQWQDEFREKGGLLVPYWDRGCLSLPDGSKENIEAAAALAEASVILLSREWARLPGNREAVLGAPRWDLVLLDEAHAARRRASEEGEFNRGNLLLDLLRELQLRRRTRSLLLLSATPMQTQPWEPWDLLTVLGVGGRWMVEFRDIRAYYDGVAALRGKGLDMSAARTIAQLIADDDGYPPSPFSLQSKTPQAIANGLAFCKPGEREKYAAWLRKGAPLGRYMHRNTRRTLREYHKMGLLGAAPPMRQVRDVVFDYQVQAERDCYEAITTYIDRRYEQLEAEKKGKGFVMTVYRRRAVSSPWALRRSLERRVEVLDRIIQKQWTSDWVLEESEEIDPGDLFDLEEEKIDPALPSDPDGALAEKNEIRSLLGRLEALGNQDSKFDRFWVELKALNADGRPALVFTEYLDTLTYLRDRLQPYFGVALGCFSGWGGQWWDGKEWQNVSKAEISERLEDGQLSVLVCTDAASEGLNLQAAAALINYDLPWNPSKVEQRIGRIDRIGQRQPQLPIRNLFIKDSVDMRVYEALRERCGLFTHFVGHMQPVLARARQALRDNLRPEQVESFLQELDKQAEAVRAEASITNAFVESEAQPPGHKPVAPVTRTDLELALEELAALDGPVRATRDKKSKAWRFSGLGRGSVLVTTDRETLEREPKIRPFTVGADVLDQLEARLPRSSRMPLVIAEYSTGPFRCAEARWVGPEGVAVVESASQLRDLLAQWDGSAPPPAMVAEAESEAARAAKQRALAMRDRSLKVEQAALRRQLEAARRRLMRELGRTLRCMDEGDLDAAFRNAVQREKSADGLYHQALRVLDGYPQWTPEEIADIDAFVKALKPKDIQARMAGSEVYAAINDPRWRARETLAAGLQ